MNKVRRGKRIYTQTPTGGTFFPASRWNGLAIHIVSNTKEGRWQEWQHGGKKANFKTWDDNDIHVHTSRCDWNSIYFLKFRPISYKKGLFSRKHFFYDHFYLKERCQTESLKMSTEESRKSASKHLFETHLGKHFPSFLKIFFEREKSVPNEASSWRHKRAPLNSFYCKDYLSFSSFLVMMRAPFRMDQIMSHELATLC